MGDKIKLNREAIASLNLSVLESEIERMFANGTIPEESQIQFVIDYQRAEDDPREFSEIPEVRLWFIRADALYPWLPYILDWKSGELVRYTAMLIPHQFSRSEGIIFNPEALEIYVMHKVFTLTQWCRERKITGSSRLISFAQLFGYEIEADFLSQL